MPSQQGPWRPELENLSLTLVEKVARLAAVPLLIQHQIEPLVCSMNCYYSNLIEGHDTHPIAIEKALQGDYSKDTKKRNLQKAQ